MIEFKIKDAEYSIGDITIGQYYKIQHLLALDSADAKLQVVHHLSGCPVEDLKELQQFQFLQLFAAIAEGPLNTEKDKKLWKHIGLHGKAYGLVNYDKLTIGEFADMDVLRVDPLKEQKLHIMMAILYRPATVISETFDWVEIEKYDGDTLDARAKEFLDLPLKYVYSALSFFLLTPKFLLNDLADSLTQEMTEKIQKETDPKMKEALKVSSLLISELLEDGMTPSTLSLETIYSKLTKLQELAQPNSSTTSHGEKTNSEKKKHKENNLN